MTISARLMHNKDRPAESEDSSAFDKGSPTLRGVIPYCLAILAVASGIIHFSAAGQHFQESWLFGVVTLIAAWLQMLWALAVVVRPSRMVWWRVGAILTSGIIVLDIATRMVGGDVAGFGGAASIVFQALVVVGCAWLALSRRDHRIGRDGLVATYGAVGIVTATILSISLVAGGPAKTASAPAPAVDRHGLPASVPLPAGVSFAGVHQSAQMPDMQYHSVIRLETWGWTVGRSGPEVLRKFYEANLSRNGWTHLQGQMAMGNPYTDARHLTACRSGQVLLITTSGTKLDTPSIGGQASPTGQGSPADRTITPPHGGTALLIQLDANPQEAQIACPNSR